MVDPDNGASGVDGGAIAEAPDEPLARASVCFFQLRGGLFAALDRDCVEIAHLDHLTPVPGAPAHLLGVSHVRGRVLPVVDISTAVGRPALERRTELEVLVVQARDSLVAIAVDRTLEYEPIDPRSVGFDSPEVPAAVAQVSMGFLGRDASVPLLDVGSILAGLRPADSTVGEILIPRAED